MIKDNKMNSLWFNVENKQYNEKIKNMVIEEFDSQDWETRPLGQAYAIRHTARPESWIL